jgi:hypothetical protein
MEDEEEGLRNILKAHVDPRACYFLVVYRHEEEEEEKRYWYFFNSGVDSRSLFFVSPFFGWIQRLFQTNPRPLSFMNEVWSTCLKKKLLYNEAAYLPCKHKDEIPAFDVNMAEIENYMNESFEDSNWLFVYDDCKNTFHIAGSDSSKDQCALVCFLRVFLKNVTRKKPFFNLDEFEASQEFMSDPALAPEKDMIQAIVGWLKNPDSGVISLVNEREEEMGLMQAVGEAQQESEDSKGKDDL